MNILFLNQINGEIPSSGVIYQQTINPRDWFHYCYKDGPVFLFGKLRVSYSIDKPCFPAKSKLLSCQIQINTLFKNNYGRKRKKFDINIHKAMRIPVKIYQTNKKFVTVKPKNVCKLEFADRLWLPFLDKPKSDILVFTINIFHIYIILIKNGNME